MVHRTDSYGMLDRAVSPVVGVILMVAITVILAAVLGQYVLNLASILQQPPQAGVTVSENYNKFNSSYNVTIMTTSMPNADKVIVQCSAQCGGSFTPKEITEVGGTARLVGLPPGAELVIMAQVGGESNRQVLLTHKVGSRT